MKPKTMILMGLAVTCGLGASYMTSRLLADRQPDEQEKVTYLVAKRQLSIGERITRPEDLFETKSVATDLVPPDAIKDIDSVKGKILKQGRNKGDHITAANMFGDKDGLDIPEGHKAMGLGVNMVTSAFGFATLPLSRVDIVLTSRGPDQKTSFSKTLLQNVLVLAADGKIDRDGISAVATVVILALKDEDVLKVNLAKEMGTLSLALRSAGDRKPNLTTGINAEQLFEKPKEVTEAPIETVKPTVVLPPPVTPVVPVVPVEEPKVVVEEPKGVQYELNIINGTQQQRSTYRVLENGRIDNSDSSEGTPPRPEPRQQKNQANPKGGSQQRDL